MDKYFRAIEKVDTRFFNGKRIFFTDHKFKKFKIIRNHNKNSSGKPRGLWYAFGASWINWCWGAGYHGLGKYIYELKISDNNIKNLGLYSHIDAYDVLLPFVKQYPSKSVISDIVSYVDWDLVSKDYDGIEFTPYNKNYFWGSDPEIDANFWYTSIDCDSGCIWSKKAFHSVKLLAIYKNGEYIFEY